MAYDYKRHFGEIAVVRDLTTMPEEARWLGIEFEDKFKTYRLWQDPERVLAETTPCQRANKVDAARAREVVRAAFGPLPSARGAATSLPS